MIHCITLHEPSVWRKQVEAGVFSTLCPLLSAFSSAVILTILIPVRKVYPLDKLGKCL